MTASHEALIVAIAQHQDRAAFAALFAHFAPRVKTYLLRSGVSAATAEEMTQEVMLSMWHRATQFDPARAGAPSWIFGIARNLRIDSARRDKLAQPHLDAFEELPAEPLADALVAAAERTARLNRAVATLPEDQVSILRLAFFEDHSHSEIQSILNIPLGTIKSRLRLALTKLRLALGDLS